jgi:3D (Asp-Asp-Asp) domain-containing protein
MRRTIAKLFLILLLPAGLLAMADPAKAPMAGRVIEARVTAYCICSRCCGKWARYAKTSTGDDAKVYDGVAVDPRMIPYRTRLSIPGIGVREADDTGGTMRQAGRRGEYHIDVRMASHQEARMWGVKVLAVTIYE